MQAEADAPKRVLITGATGFVGSHVLKQLVSSGFIPVCLVRDSSRGERLTDDYGGAEIQIVEGSINSPSSLAKAADLADMAIHLVGIIMERGEQTFSRVHYEGTCNVLKACQDAGIKRYVHMSALGSRLNAVSKYHQTKFMAEEAVRKSGLDWTVFQPSLIHGPNGEFMQLMKRFMCSLVPPVIPYFGNGKARLQPVDVRDVAECFVKALTSPATVHQTLPLGGPRTYSWKELYQACKRLIPGALQWKPMVPQPVPIAKLVASTVMKIPAPGDLDKLRFNIGQVQMSQEDNVCDISEVERRLDIVFRDFETELTQYADQIR